MPDNQPKVDLDHTHIVVVKNDKAKEFLRREWLFFGEKAIRGESMGQGDALVLRDSLQDAGFKWRVDFYLKKVSDG